MAMIGQYIAPQLFIAQDPLNIEKIVGQMDTFVRDNNQSKALVGFALHDLKGKVPNVPVYQLLGGKNAEASEQGWVAGAGAEEEMAGEARRALDAGFSLIKIKSRANARKTCGTLPAAGFAYPTGFAVWPSKVLSDTGNLWRGAFHSGERAVFLHNHSRSVAAWRNRLRPLGPQESPR
ncbi:hypothetical protein GCM10009825_11600 [Arthrobacter humicola]|uniref:Mandelate racemase/muconate lactonizing enzyme N-terminal domain-containing protein n=1 Tax=Arthrobacter humicola TaxID=409291 RepID=A0ABN2YS86_9MICC